VKAYHRETQRSPSELANCHHLAFEFAYSLTLAKQPPAGWTWCVAFSPVVQSTHSWIEHEDEALDVEVTNKFSDHLMTVVLVQPRRRLWTQHHVTNVQPCSFQAFARWLHSPKSYPLFSRYPHIAAQKKWGRG
jgi:hypothetical protein